MIYFIYDNTFEGLLTSIYEAYYTQNKPDEIVSEKEFIPNLLSEPIYINTDIEKSQKVEKAIKEKISTNALNNIYFAFLSEIEGSSTKIYTYIKLGFKLGSEIDEHIYKDEIRVIHEYRRKVLLERHRFHGFVRFKEYDGFLYSKIEPDHNILHLIVPHFISRLPNEKFIIHDIKRNIGAVYNGEKWDLFDLELDKSKSIPSSSKEEEYDKLWQEYFKTIAIKNRENPKVQKGYMPVRYWKNLNEFGK